jgi:hypothetical protein
LGEGEEEGEGSGGALWDDGGIRETSPDVGIGHLVVVVGRIVLTIALAREYPFHAIVGEREEMCSGNGKFLKTPLCGPLPARVGGPL